MGVMHWYISRRRQGVPRVGGWDREGRVQGVEGGEGGIGGRGGRSGGSQPVRRQQLAARRASTARRARARARARARGLRGAGRGLRRIARAHAAAAAVRGRSTGFPLSCAISHYLALSRTILHYLALSCTILHYLALSCIIAHRLAPCAALPTRGAAARGTRCARPSTCGGVLTVDASTSSTAARCVAGPYGAAWGAPPGAQRTAPGAHEPPYAQSSMPPPTCAPRRVSASARRLARRGMRAATQTTPCPSPLLSRPSPGAGRGRPGR
jgi:hypothetical protein